MKTVVRGELKITGGERRGAKLFTVPGPEVRPALARLRKSLFDVLGPRVTDAFVVDLFGGTGSLALEALSRGARGALVFEIDARCAEAVRRNAEKLGYAGRVEVVPESAFRAAELLAVSGRSADLVFVDPPYATYESPEEWGRLRETLERMPLGEEAVVVMEHRSRFDPPAQVGCGRRGETRSYGGTSLTFYA